MNRAVKVVGIVVCLLVIYTTLKFIHHSQKYPQVQVSTLISNSMYPIMEFILFKKKIFGNKKKLSEKKVLKKL
jgi:hypothetical protein